MQPKPVPTAGPPPVSQAMPKGGAAHSHGPEPGAALPEFHAAPNTEVPSIPPSSLLSLQTAVLNPPPAPLVNAAPSAAATTASAATTSATHALIKNSVTQRKVAKLLDITTSSDIKDLANYVDEVLLGYFYSADADDGISNNGKGDGEVVSTSSNIGSRGPGAAAGGLTKAITSSTLRSALDHRAIDMHKGFLQEFTAVYQNFQRVAARVKELQEKCSGLEAALSAATGGSASAADEFFYEIQTHQAELQLVQHQEKEVDHFRREHHFGPAEQRVLDEGPVNMNFLKVLEHAREVHWRSSELMQSQEYHQGAAEVMESTYAAITRATEKIARHLLATTGSASTAVAGRGDASAAAATAGVGVIAADVPEITGFQLRCVRILCEESPSLYEQFLGEVARLRRASVLRRYFHLLTTGSANTASGMYQSGGQPRADADGGAAWAGMGARPLEAELNNPTYFFSALCAWLHQTIVEEQDFLQTFFMNDEAEPPAGRRGNRDGVTTARNAPAASLVHAERAKQDLAHLGALLDNVFGGVCKHIRAALDNVLERLGRSASALGAAKGEDQAVAVGSAEDGAAESHTQAPQKGPRGLTGGLTRLFMAATGRAPLGSFRRKDIEGSNAHLQRYATVTTRAQLEAVALSMLNAPLHGVQTCVTLVQLFEYYSATTFTPLLGEGSALTKLIRETAPQQTSEVFQRLLRVLAAHLLDSTAGVVHRTAPLRRLASSNVLNNTAAGAQGASCAKDSDAPPTSPLSSTYILHFLTSMTYGEDSEDIVNASLHGLANESRSDFSASTSSTGSAKFRQASDGQLQRHSAQDLRRVLTQLILPPSPEILAYCSVLKAVLRDAARQADLLQAVAQKQRVADAAGVAAGFGATCENAASGAGTAFHLRTEVKGFVRDLLHMLWRSAHAVQEDGTLHAHLDDPCRSILQYNILYQLQEIMEQHSEVLDLLCGAADTDKQATTGETAESGDIQQDFDTLRAEVGATMNALRRRLLSQWAEAVARFYFPLSADTVVAAALTANALTTEPPAATETEEQRHTATRKDLRRALKHVVHVYNTIASMGHLPEPVPLLTALCGAEQVRRAVGVEITKHVVERVYPAQFSALQKLPPDEELTAVQEEMSPQNLGILVDFSSPPTSTLEV